VHDLPVINVPPLVPRSVTEAFGLTGTPVALAGGEGTSVQIGGSVLKPVDEPVEAAWSAELFSRLEEDGFRLARPLRASNGSWVVDGWAATTLVEGRSGPPGRWSELLSAARAFHKAVRGESRPSFLDHRTHRWALADRVAWGEASVEPVGAVALLLEDLTRLLRPVREQRNQLVHGDLSGNVLFTPGLPPAIIDFSPYWRPATYAEAITAVDGLLWFDAANEVLHLVRRDSESTQLFLRAVIFRLVALNEYARVDPSAVEDLPLFWAATAQIGRLGGKA
jgi:uncharacterized protein (TIGR02569 family)